MVPAIRVEDFGVERWDVEGIPDGGGVVEGVGRNGEGGVLWEVVAKEGDTWAWGNEAGEAEGGGRVDAEGFVDEVVEAGKV